MSKQEFLQELEDALSGLPQDDIDKSLEFYSEAIDDRVEDGLSEEQAIAQLGDAQEIAKQILMEIPITKLVKQKIKPCHRIGLGENVLLVLGSPIWLSLVASAIATLISVYVSLWAVVISLWACEAAFIGSAAGGFAAACIVFATGQNVYAGFIMLAAGILLIGLSILFFFVCKWVSKGMLWITKKFTLWIKSLFLRKGQK